MPPHLHECEPSVEERRIDIRSAPVRDGVIQGTVPAGHVNRPVDLDRRAVLDSPGAVARRVVEIHDVTVPRVVRVDLAMGHAPQTFVLSRQPKALSVQCRRLDHLQVDSGDLGGCVRGDE